MHAKAIERLQELRSVHFIHTNRKVLMLETSRTSLRTPPSIPSATTCLKVAQSWAIVPV
jgi:hypothetical protein